MLVYGDHKQRISARERIDELRRMTAAAGRLEHGLERHSAMTTLLIECGRLLQGVADADFEEAGLDRLSPAQAALSDWLLRIAEAVARSSAGESASLPPVETLAALPESVDLKLAEGYAFYAVYPEAYAEAARALTLNGPPRVIGIRSIGTSLAAMVAAALDAPAPVTVRPFGDPFDRRIALSVELERHLLADPSHFVVVDEGPGLSGSSFGSVADWLEARGVPLERIAFICSHGAAPGAEALPRHRERWAKVQFQAADYGPKLGDLVAEWTSGLLGPLDERPVDLSSGSWRQLRYADEVSWPPTNPMWERRKFLLRAGGTPYLAKFAGLGAEGDRKLFLARTLHASGLVPEPIALVHGFLIERWHEDASPLGTGEKPLPELACYIGARARLPAAGQPRTGTDLAQLHAMAKRNISLALGNDTAALLDQWRVLLPSLQQRVVPVCSDNRMDRAEWLRLPDGPLLKADALDHHAAHDLIGCQDAAWDVAGAAVEFDLDDAETAWLAAEAERLAGRPIDAELIAFMRLAYCAFRLGQGYMARSITDPDEGRRWSGEIERHSSALNDALAPHGATRREGLIVEHPERTGSGTKVCSLG